MKPPILSASFLIPLLSTVGCGDATPAKPARLFREGGGPVRVMVLTKTGDGIPAPFARELSSGLRVTIVRDEPPEPVIRVRLEEGQYRGLEATAPREAVRPGG